MPRVDSTAAAVVRYSAGVHFFITLYTRFESHSTTSVVIFSTVVNREPTNVASVCLVIFDSIAFYNGRPAFQVRVISAYFDVVTHATIYLYSSATLIALL